ncbi:hypothetical protein ABK040_007354 [Willaertia magna]
MIISIMVLASLFTTIQTHPLLSLLTITLLAILIKLGRNYWLGPKIPKEFITDKSNNLTNKIVIITGVAHKGIGYYTAEQLIELGATVVLAVRNTKQGEITKEALIKNSQNKEVYVMELDLINLDSVVKFVKQFKEKFNNNNTANLHLLINNAGIMFHPHDTTKQGIEIQFGTNHLGHFLLTYLLLDLLKKNNARIINVSSLAHTMIRKESDVTGKDGFSSFSSVDLVKGDCKTIASVYDLYGRSKFANILFTKKLNRLLMNSDENNKENNTKARAYCLHPGVVDTNLSRYLPKWMVLLANPLMSYFVKTPLYGAQTTLYCALAPDDKLTPGGYYSDCKEKESTAFTHRVELQDRLWDVSMELCKSYLQ